MNFIKDILSYSRQRVKNPFFMAFLFSWFALNHDYLFIMFSNDDLTNKFSMIESHLYPIHLWGFEWISNSSIAFSVRSLVVPAILACVYIGVMPWLQGLLIEIWDKRQNKLLERQKEAQGQTLISEEDRDKLYAELEDERSKWRIKDKEKDEAFERESRKKEREIAVVNEEIEGLNRLLKENQERYEEDQNKIKEGYIKKIEALKIGQENREALIEMKMEKKIKAFEKARANQKASDLRTKETNAHFRSLKKSLMDEEKKLPSPGQIIPNFKK